MAVLIVLIVSFAGSLGITKLISSEWNYILSGNIAMCIMLLFTAFGHFRFSRGMALMIPKFIPNRLELVYLTGFMEVAAATGLLFPYWRYSVGQFLILFFVMILPANIYATIHKLDYQTGKYDGKGVGYLWFRIPMQLFLIAWVWYFSVSGLN